MATDLIHTCAAEVLQALESYHGEDLPFDHPVTRGMRRLARAYGGRLPSYLNGLWDHLKADRSVVAAETLRRWLQAVAGDADVPPAAAAETDADFQTVSLIDDADQQETDKEEAANAADGHPE